MMSSLLQWNARQLCVLQRYGRIHHVTLTPDMVSGLASRYAAKHADERPPAGTARLGRSRSGALATTSR
ncbi:MAG: hypothetical protein ACXW61_14695 [Gemmatirosa sp.]